MSRGGKVKLKKEVRLHIEHDEQVVQWGNDDPDRVWLDLKEPESRGDKYKICRAVLRVSDLVSVRELIDKALAEIAAASPPSSNPEDSKR